MAIYCVQCGKELPDDAIFCLKCGKQVGDVVKSTPQLEPQWEYCEVVYGTVKPWGVFRKGSFVFWAQATGPKGRYDAGQSPEVVGSGPFEGYEDSESVLDDFIKKLSQDGWQLLPNKGDLWFNYKFRRKVN